MFLLAQINRKNNSFQKMYDMLQAKVDPLAGKIYFVLKNKTISDGGITVDFWIIKVHTSN